MKVKLLVVLGALLLGAGALIGVQFSSADFTSQSDTDVSVNSAPDWTPPTVSLTNPGTPVFGTVVLSATASDADSSVASVTIERRPAGSSTWTEICNDANPPYSCSWNTTQVTDGDNELRAIAVDAHSNTATSAVVTTAVFNTPSVVLEPIPSPASGVVLLSATFHNSGGSPVSIKFQGFVQGMGWVDVPGCGPVTGNTRSCNYDTTGAADGVYDWRAVAVVSGTTYYDVQDDVLVDNTDPSVTLTVPAAPLTGNVNLTATANDAGSGVESVAFEYRITGAPSWQQCALDVSSPYACALDTTALAEGNYQFRAVGTDEAGNITTTGTQSRAIDHVAPTVALTVPSGILSGTVALTATASDGSGVASVAFQYRRSGVSTWTTACTDNIAAYTCSPNTSGWTDDTYEFQAVATDNAGRTTTTAIQSRLVDNNNPATVLTVPAGALRGTVNVTATATDGNGIQSVALQYRQTGTTPWTTCATDTSAPYECSVNTLTLNNGNHEFRAIATDNANRTTTTSIQTRMVDNLAPTSSPTVPNGTLSNAVTLTATTSDSHSGIASVLFEYRLVGGSTWTACGSDTSATGGYTCVLDTTALDNGSYQFRAISTDVAGNSTTSATVGPRTVTNTTFGVDVQATNANSQAQAGDSLIFTFNRRVNPASIKAGWNGLAGTPVNVTMSGNNVAGGPVANRDWASFNVNLGAVAFQQNYLSNNGTGSFTNGTMTMTTTTVSGVTRSVVTVTFGQRSGTFTTDSNNGVMVWRPSAAITSATGTATPCSTANVNETGDDTDL